MMRERYITKQGKRVLLILFNVERIFAGDLAKQMNTSKNNLSNIIERLKRDVPELLVMEKKGRQIEYSLSEEGREYVETYLNSDEADALFKENFAGNPTNKKESFSNKTKEREELYEKIEKCLDELEREDEYWYESVTGILRKSAQKTASKSLVAWFKEFLALLFQLRLDAEDNRYEGFMKRVDNRSAREYIDGIIARRIELMELWEIAADDWKKAYKLLNVCFEQMGCFVLGAEYMKPLYKIGLSKTAVREIMFDLQEIISEANEDGLTKEEFSEVLKEEGAGDEQYVPFIAEKYDAVRSKN